MLGSAQWMMVKCKPDGEEEQACTNLEEIGQTRSTHKNRLAVMYWIMPDGDLLANPESSRHPLCATCRGPITAKTDPLRPVRGPVHYVLVDNPRIPDQRGTPPPLDWART